MKRIMCIAAAALLLVSCADSDSSKTATADLTGESPRSVYQGADDFMGKSYPGFVMPENFDVPEIQRAYTVTFSSTIKEAAVERGKELLKKWFGDKYDPRCVVTDGNNSLVYSPINLADELGIADDDLEGAVWPDVGGSGFFSPGWISVSDNYTFPSFQSRISAETMTEKEYNEALKNYVPNTDEYRVASDGGSLIQLKDGEISVAQEAHIADEKLNELLGDYAAPFEIKTIALTVDHDSEQIQALAALTCEGIPIQCYSTDGEVYDENNGTESPLVVLLMGMFSLDNELHQVIASEMPDTVSLSEPLERIISLKRAIGILQETLDPALTVEFSDVRLMYCGRETMPWTRKGVEKGGYTDQQLRKEYYAKPKTLNPTWCFFIKGDRIGVMEKCIKINAVIGEVTFDTLTKD